MAPTVVSAVALESLSKTFGGGEGAIRALDDVSLRFTAETG
jgi:hypothetical protein